MELPGVAPGYNAEPPDNHCATESGVADHEGDPAADIAALIVIILDVWGLLALKIRCPRAVMSLPLPPEEIDVPTNSRSQRKVRE